MDGKKTMLKAAFSFALSTSGRREGVMGWHTLGLGAGGQDSASAWMLLAGGNSDLRTALTSLLGRIGSIGEGVVSESMMKEYLCLCFGCVVFERILFL